MAECCLCSVVLEVSSPGRIALVVSDEQDTVLTLGDVVIIGGTVEEYEGPCEVIPKINADQILLTKDKLMPDDVTVHEITVSNVSNPYGGQTVTIGIV